MTNLKYYNTKSRFIEVELIEFTLQIKLNQFEVTSAGLHEVTNGERKIGELNGERDVTVLE